MSIELGENESAKYWLGVLNSLKNRGLRDILILCAEGIERRCRDCLSSVNFNIALSTNSYIRLSMLQLRSAKISPPI
ncbi:MAG: transposase [Selenomonadaceae bacterium]|nr:transposase [Selenomonadaceae bacterium]